MQEKDQGIKGQGQIAMIIEGASVEDYFRKFLNGVKFDDYVNAIMQTFTNEHVNDKDADNISALKLILAMKELSARLIIMSVRVSNAYEQKEHMSGLTESLVDSFNELFAMNKVPLRLGFIGGGNGRKKDIGPDSDEFKGPGAGSGEVVGRDQKLH